MFASGSMSKLLRPEFDTENLFSLMSFLMRISRDSIHESSFPCSSSNHVIYSVWFISLKDCLEMLSIRTALSLFLFLFLRCPWVDSKGSVAAGESLSVEFVVCAQRKGAHIVNIDCAIVRTSYKELVELLLTLKHARTPLISQHSICHNALTRQVSCHLQ